MRRIAIGFGIGFGLAGLLLAAQAADADDGFYRGKRVSILVNYAPGGPTDIEARVFAKHIGKYLDGNQTVIVQNMDGGGGITGTNYLGEVAPKDGTMFGYLTGTAFQYANDPRGRRADYRTYEFIAYQPGTSVYFMRADLKPGMTTATDIVKAQGLISGGLGVDNAKDILLRLTLDMLGVKFGYVTAYKGSQGARLALQQGEINFYSESPPSYRGVIEPSLVAKGEVIPVFYDPSYDGQKFMPTSQMAGLDILPFHEFYKKINGRMPEGKLWEIYKSIIALNGAMQRMVVMPPSAPPAAVTALRAAINKLNVDKAYGEDAVKAFGFVPEWVADDGTAERVRKQLVLDPETKAFLHDYIRNPPKNN